MYIPSLTLNAELVCIYVAADASAATKNIYFRKEDIG